jgi:hypothetical protein
MFGHNGGVKDRVSGAAGTVRGAFTGYVDPLARDEKLRQRLIAALTTGAAARDRARKQMGVTGLARRLAMDPVLRAQLTDLTAQLRGVRRQVEKTQSHKLRNTLLVVGGIGLAAAAAPVAWKAVSSLLQGDDESQWAAASGWPAQRGVAGAVESETVVTSVRVEAEPGPAD